MREEAIPLWILGCGSQARYVIEIARRSGVFEVVGISDVEGSENVGKLVNGIQIVCEVSDLASHFPSAPGQIVIAYGENSKKRVLADHFQSLGYRFATVISPEAYISEFATIGKGTIVNPMVSIMPNANIGSHVIIHSQSVIEHDCVIRDYANIGPGVCLAGNVQIGEETYIYTGASVIPKVRIGARSAVGAGAAVIRDVPDRVKVAGVPAEIFEKY